MALDQLCCMGRPAVRLSRCIITGGRLYLWTPELEHPGQRFDAHCDLGRSALIGTRT